MKPKAPKPRKPPFEAQPAAFWEAQYKQAVADAASARGPSPSVVPALLKLQREAWREWQAAVAVEETGSSTDDATLEGQLAIARRLRKSAEAAGSYVAAKDLLRTEGEIADAIRTRDEIARKAARANQSPEEFVAALAGKVAAMPPVMQQAIRDKLGW